MAKLLFFLFLGSVCFLYALNLFLRGSKKPIIEAILGITIILGVIASFYLFGLGWGLVTLLSPFILVGVSRPFAQAIAYRLLGYRTGVEGQPESRDRMFEHLESREEEFNKLMEEVSREDGKNRQRLVSLASSPAISSILIKHNVTIDYYEELFRSLWESALHDLSWEIVTSPHDLDSLIQMKKQGKSDPDIWSYFRNFK